MLFNINTVMSNTHWVEFLQLIHIFHWSYVITKQVDKSGYTPLFRHLEISLKGSDWSQDMRSLTRSYEGYFSVLFIGGAVQCIQRFFSNIPRPGPLKSHSWQVSSQTNNRPQKVDTLGVSSQAKNLVVAIAMLIKLTIDAVG